MSPVIEDQPKLAKAFGKSIFLKAVAVTVFIVFGLCLFVYFDAVGASMYISGHPEKALEPTKRALWVQELVLGHDNLEVANTRKNLARVYDSLKRYDEAEVLYCVAMNSFEAQNKKETPEYAQLLCYYGDHLMREGKHTDALESYKEGIDYVKEIHGEQTKEYAWMLQRTAIALKALNRNEEAVGAEQDAAVILGIKP